MAWVLFVALLPDETCLVLKELELRSKTACCLLSALMPVAPNSASEWMGHVVSPDPAHHLLHERLVVHVNMLVEGVLVVEPLDVEPDIWFGLVWDGHDGSAARHVVPDLLSSRVVHLLVLLGASLWQGALTVDDEWLGFCSCDFVASDTFVEIKLSFDLVQVDVHERIPIWLILGFEPWHVVSPYLLDGVLVIFVVLHHGERLFLDLRTFFCH